MRQRRLLAVIGFAGLWLAACSPPAPASPSSQPTSPAQLATSALVPTVTSLPATSAPTLSPAATNPSTVVQMPDPANYAWVPVVNGLTSPTDIKNAGEGSGRLFILEQPGRIRILKNGQLLQEPFFGHS